MELVIRCTGGEARVLSDVPHGKQIENWKRGRFYEAPFLEHLRANYRGGTWIDAGSALGNHTLFMAAFCECACVVSIDPIRASLDWQERILELNGVRDKVQIYHAALADWTGFGTMERFGPGVGHWRLTRQPGDVPVVTLDDLDIPDVRVLKLDVEGSELVALRGARTLLREQRPAVFAECNSKEEMNQIGAFLSGMRYGYGGHFHTMHEWRTE